MKTIKILCKALFVSSLFILASCSNDDGAPDVINQLEEFTKVEVILKNTSDTNDVVTLTVEQDADGSNPKTSVSGPLKASATYNGDIQFFGLHEHDDEHDHEEEEDHDHDHDSVKASQVKNEVPKDDGHDHDNEGENHDDDHDEDGEPENITEEILEEGTDHEVFYTLSNDIIIVTKLDNDKEGNPLGLKTTFKTGKKGKTTLTVSLRHKPTKPNNGRKEDAGGASDVEVNFNLEVE